MGGIGLCSSCCKKPASNENDENGEYQYEVYKKVPVVGSLKDYQKQQKQKNDILPKNFDLIIKKGGSNIGEGFPASPTPQNNVFPSTPPASTNSVNMINQKPLDSVKTDTSLFDVAGEKTYVKKIKKSKYAKIIRSMQGTSDKFTDLEFGHDLKSLGKLQKFDLSRIKWLRITQMLKDPIFINQSIRPEDILQGALGDCYFHSAIACLAEQDFRIKNIFTSLEISPYGIYMARVIFNGIYQQVVVDDFFPANERGEPIFAKPAGKREIWVMVLEKCWAKLNGSYANIVGGFSYEVSHAFSSAPVFYKHIPKDDQKQQKLWKLLAHHQKIGSLFCAGSKTLNKVLEVGLVRGHAYSVLGIYEKPTRMIKMRNPWGYKQWRGKASDQDLEFWKNVNVIDKQTLGYTDQKRNQDKDGVFFMLWQEFLQYFQIVDICEINDNAHYNFLETKLQHLTPKLFQFQVRGPEATVTFALTQPTFPGSQLDRFSRSYLALGKWDQQSKSYKYVRSNSDRKMADHYLQIKKASAGKYVLYAKYLWSYTDNRKAVVSIYSQLPAQITELQADITPQDFLKQIFYDHASENSKKKVINKEGDWVCSDILLNDGGFSYFVANVNKDSKTKLGVTINQSQYLQKKLRLQPSLKGCRTFQEEVSSSKPLVVIAELIASAFPDKITNPSPKVVTLQ